MIRQTQYGPVTRFDLARTLAGRGRYWTTAYLVEGLMIDTGCAFTARELAQQLDRQPVDCIFNTHTHEDHIGGNGILQRKFTGLPIKAHPLSLPVLSDPCRTQPLHPYRRVFWGWPERSDAEAVVEGEQIRTEHYCFQVIHTPGHAPDHQCLYEEDQGWIFSGDLFVGGQDRALRAGYDIWQIIASLKKIAGLSLITLFPGSARVRADEPNRHILEKIEYLEGLGQQVLALHQQGRSVPDIGRVLMGKRMYIELITLGHFSRRNLVLSYLGINQEK